MYGSGSLMSAGSSEISDLVGRIRSIITQSKSSQGHGPAVIDMFVEAESALDTLDAAIAKLESFVVLTGIPEEGRRMEEARSIWMGLPPERRAGDPTDLVAASPTLAALSQAAVNINAVERFSDAQIELATVLGSNLQAYPHYVQQLADEGGDFMVSPKAVEALRTVLRWMESRSIAQGFVLEFTYTPFTSKTKEWQTLSGKSLPTKAVSFRVKNGSIAEGRRAFIGGHWLTAYAYWIALDQFQRLNVPFEIYTNVEYSLPADLGGGKSDIDVLVRTSRLIVCIECKSGAVTVAKSGPSQARKTAISASRLEAVFAKMGIDLERSYSLLYLPRASDDPKVVVAELAAGTGSNITMETMTPETTRTIVQDLSKRA